MNPDLVHAAQVAAEGASGGWGLRALLAFAMLLLLAAALGGLRVAWKRRAEQQEEELPELPHPPEHPGSVLAAPLRGMYLGTVDAGHWLEWFSGHGHGGRDGGYVTVYDTGIRVDRAGTPFWIPREAVRGARLERARAGKVVGPGRLVVIAWSFGDHELETGFRGEDRARQPKVVRAVHDLIGPAPAYPSDGDVTRPRPVPRARLRPRPDAPAPATTGPAGVPAATTPAPAVTYPAPGATRAPLPPARPPALPVAHPAVPPRPPAPAYPAPGTTRPPAPVRPPASPAARPAVPPRPPAPAPAGAYPAPEATRAPLPSVRPPVPARPPAPGWPAAPPAARPHPTPVPGATAGGRPAAYTRPAQPTRPQPARPTSADPARPDVDPLTSPFGEVVRRMREDR